MSNNLRYRVEGIEVFDETFKTVGMAKTKKLAFQMVNKVEDKTFCNVSVVDTKTGEYVYNQQSGWNVICKDTLLGTTITDTIEFYVSLWSCKTGKEAIAQAKRYIDCTSNAVFTVKKVSHKDLKETN